MSKTTTEATPIVLKKTDNVIIKITEYKGNRMLQIMDLQSDFVFRAGASNIAPIVANIEAAIAFLKESTVRSAAPAIEAFDKAYKKR